MTHEFKGGDVVKTRTERTCLVLEILDSEFFGFDCALWSYNGLYGQRFSGHTENLEHSRHPYDAMVKRLRQSYALYKLSK